MANTDYSATLTRPHWGSNAQTDIHIEMYKGEVDTAFGYQAIFKGLSQQRSVAPNTNTYRIDRMGASRVMARTVGVKLEDQRVLDDKLTIVVDTTVYIRNTLDWQDDWTSPDRWSEMARNNGTEFAREFDQSHIIKLQKARTWKAPAHLKGTDGKGQAFYDGLEVAANLTAAATTQAKLEENALALELAHKKVVETMITRRVPLGNMVTLVTPAVFSELTHHPKLLNADFASNNGDYAGRRVLRINGISIVECTEFPTKAGTHHLSNTTNGNAFNTTADDIKCEMVVFDKSMSLLSVHAHELETKYWVDNQNFADVLDMYAMYTCEVRRPDTVGVVKVTRA